MPKSIRVVVIVTGMLFQMVPSIAEAPGFHRPGEFQRWNSNHASATCDDGPVGFHGVPTLELGEGRG